MTTNASGTTMAAGVGSTGKNKKQMGRESFSPAPAAYLPYACYLDSETLVTKNGELLQILKIEDFMYASDEQKYFDIRNIIRQSITQRMQNTGIGIWLHNVRSSVKSDELDNSEGLAGFSLQLHEEYIKKLSDCPCFINSIYISIMICDSSKKKTPFKGYSNKFKSMSARINKITNGIIEDIKGFSPTKLSLHKEKDSKKIYSDHLSFFHKLMHFEDQKIYLPQSDLSEYLVDNLKVAFGYNNCESIFENKKRFFNSFALKFSRDIPLKSLDKLLQIPQEFIISEFAYFTTENKKFTKSLEQYSEYLGISANDDLAEKVGLNVFYDPVQNTSPIKYIEHLVTITIKEDFLFKLDESAKSLITIASSLGMVLVKCDLLLENTFWGKMPGNFAFNVVTHTKHKSAIGSFSNLHHYYSGTLRCNQWKTCVTKFLTSNNHHYFFNFFDMQNNGLTSMIGATGTGRTILTNFLISESTKIPNLQLLYLDSSGKSEIFINALGRKYCHVFSNSDTEQTLNMNPFKIPKTESNIEYLTTLIQKMRGPLTAQEKGIQITLENIQEKISAAVDALFDLPMEDRLLSNVSIDKLQEIGGKIDLWHGEGRFANIFDNADGDVWNSDVTGININNIVNDPLSVSATIHHILKQFQDNCNGGPCILVIDDCWKIVSTFGTHAALEEWITLMKSMNIVVIFCIDVQALRTSSKFIKFINHSVGTQIFLPINYLHSSYADIFNVNREELNSIRYIPIQGHHFIMKKDGHSTLLKLNLDDIKELSMLSCNTKLVEVMKGTKHEESNNDDWLQRFYEAIAK